MFEHDFWKLKNVPVVVPVSLRLLLRHVVGGGGGGDGGDGGIVANVG